MTPGQMGDAGADGDSVRRHGDGAGKNIKLAPDHMRVADPKTIVTKCFGAARQSDGFAGVVRAVNAGAEFYLCHGRPLVGFSK